MKNSKSVGFIFSLLVCAVFFSIFSLPDFAAGSSSQIYKTDTAVISAVAETIDPYPVEPGTEFSVQLRVYNYGGELADSVSVSVEDSDTFFLTGEKEHLDEPFSLCGGCAKEDTFYFTAMPNVNSGEYPIVFKVDDGGSVYSKIVSVKVVGKPDVIFSASMQNESIATGEYISATLSISNVGTGVARNIKLKPATTGIVMKDENLLFIEEIKPGQTVKRDIVFMVEESIVPGPESLLFDISYKDEGGSSSQFSQSLGFMIEDVVDMDISSLKLEPAVFQLSEEGTLTLRIENLGKGSAKDVRVELVADDFSGNKEAFLGKIEEDEDAPAIFKLTPKGIGSKDVLIRITYKDDTGTKEITEKVAIDVRSVSKGAVFVVLICVAVAGAAAYFVIKGKKKRKADED